TTGTSRWLNFYVEGMRWLVENEHIDGLYLDDIAFDGATTERIRKVLLRGNPGGLIDVHSANQYNPRDGFASSANLYLEQFPFIDRLWFGEYFDYNSPPDYWLIEMSGIPYGLMGEMLQGGGNPWRGMVYGMTTRAPWSGDPRPLWTFWDAYQIENTRMIGYWVPSSPVKTKRKGVLATTYLGKGRALVALASWDNQQTDVKLAIDWKALGLNPRDATVYAPKIENFQDERTFAANEAIPVQPGKGWLLVIEKKGATAAGLPHK
ncbi:MAG TPA: glycoside hydrolase domain-containing protein, partial [Dyella sp.]|nr:glycoside hydrolase domain-containing protein [Dyella sp.]